MPLGLVAQRPAGRHPSQLNAHGSSCSTSFLRPTLRHVEHAPSCASVGVRSVPRHPAPGARPRSLAPGGSGECTRVSESVWRLPPCGQLRLHRGRRAAVPACRWPPPLARAAGRPPPPLPPLQAAATTWTAASGITLTPDGFDEVVSLHMLPSGHGAAVTSNKVFLSHDEGRCVALSSRVLLLLPPARAPLTRPATRPV